MLTDFISPPFCINCHSFGNYICSQCLKSFKFYKDAIPLQIQPSWLDEMYSAVHFSSPATELIHQLKFSSYWSLAETIAEIMGHFLPMKHFPDVLTFVPLHSDREWMRGFNQAERISTVLANQWKIPQRSVLFRKKSTTPQAQLNRTQRLTHLQDAFIYKSGHNIENKVIGLVDDVTTTGTTLNECAKILKQKGAKKVIGLVFAHGN